MGCVVHFSILQRVWLGAAQQLAEENRRGGREYGPLMGGGVVGVGVGNVADGLLPLGIQPQVKTRQVYAPVE